jgi:transposase
MAVQATRQEIVHVLRKTGFTEVAESPSVSLFQPVCGGGWLRWGRCPDVKTLLVDGFTTKIACPTGSFRVLVYLSGVDVSTSTLRYLSACVRTRRRAAGTQRPDALYADRGYDHDKYRRQVREAGIKPVIVRRGEQNDSGLGVYRWVVEQGFALLHWFRRLRIRSEIRDDIHEGFLRFACAIICWRRLHNISNC